MSNYSTEIWNLTEFSLLNSTGNGSAVQTTTVGQVVTTAYTLEREISRWLMAVIIVLGVVTNTMIIAVLLSRTWKSCMLINVL